MRRAVHVTAGQRQSDQKRGKKESVCARNIFEMSFFLDEKPQNARTRNSKQLESQHRYLLRKAYFLADVAKM